MGQDTRIVVCKHCGLVQVNPRPKEEDINKLYKKDYHSQSLSSGRPNKIYIKNRAALANQRVNFITNLMKVQGKTILDVGCSYGEFLKKISPLVKEVKGIEPGNELSSYGKKSARGRYF